MRRTLAGLLFGLAYACASLLLAGFLLQRTAFDPDRAAANADVVLGDPAIKAHLVDRIATDLAQQAVTMAPTDPNLTPQALHDRVTYIAGTKAGSELLAKVVHDAHAVLIGAQDGPVELSPAQLVDATQNQAAAIAKPVIIDVPRVGVLSLARTALHWLVPIAAIATLALVVLALVARPDRSALFRSLGLGLLLLALVTIVVAYLVPKFLVPALTDDPWANVPARLADDMLPMLVALELLLVGGALALLVGTGMMKRRQRWSTPVSTYRYQEERRWSG